MAIIAQFQRAGCSTLKAVIAGLLLLAGGITYAEGLGHCYSAKIPTVFALPDGSTHPAGLLKVCLTRNISPVAGGHETYANGMPVGLFLSRHTLSETQEATRPYFVFRRSGDVLVLQGYTAPDGDRLRNYDLLGDRITTAWYLALNRKKRSARNPSTADATAWVLIAAN